MIGAETQTGRDEQCHDQEAGAEVHELAADFGPSPEEIAAWQQTAAEIGTIAYSSTSRRIRRSWSRWVLPREADDPVKNSDVYKQLQEQGLV